MNVNIEINGLAQITGLNKEFSAILEKIVPTTLTKIGLISSTLIKDRVTKRNTDINGERFAPYSDVTLALAKKRGRSGKSKNNVNLFDTGKLMNSIIPSLQSTSDLIITVAGAPAVYGLQHQIGNDKLPKREWFGLDGKDQEFIFRKFEKEFSLALRGVM